MTRDELLARLVAIADKRPNVSIGHVVEHELPELRAQAEAMPDTKGADYDWVEEARQIAAACWCEPETSKTQMDVALAEVFTQRLAAWMRTGAFHARNQEYWRERALKAEAMPAQEPVAWRCDWAYWRQYHDECNPLPDRWDRDDVPTITPLYTTPPDQTARIKELEGLLHDAKERISHSAIHDVDCSLCEGCKIEERIRAALLAALTKGE